MSELAQLIHDFVEALPAARRLYPDLWSEELAELIKQGEN